MEIASLVDMIAELVQFVPIMLTVMAVRKNQPSSFSFSSHPYYQLKIGISLSINTLHWTWAHHPHKRSLSNCTKAFGSGWPLLTFSRKSCDK